MLSGMTVAEITERLEAGHGIHKLAQALLRVRAQMVAALLSTVRPEVDRERQDAAGSDMTGER